MKLKVKLVQIRFQENFTQLWVPVSPVSRTTTPNRPQLQLHCRWQPSETSDRNSVPLELRKVLEAMKDKSQTSPHRNFLKCLHEYNICRYTEHDADEVFHTILGLIQEQTDQQTAAEIRNLYKINLEVCTECLHCQNVHRVPNIFLSLPLHLHEDTNTLYYKLLSLPSILCINLKRFRNIHGFTRKLNSKVSFLETINVAEMLPEEHPRTTESRYRLYAVVVHAGMATMGHYTAYIYSTDDKWYYIDDSHMHQVSWQEVQSTYEGRGRFSETAYMLLYRTLSSETAQKSAL
ncbi:Ubl carboxyl-terminal hydrolase 18 [Bagarius yarrelli]|uniref:Ubl carboxyl-terminal hydrolase 18 n=1 Tax=Bagarius yarrelli TaxID=175774 RepID=A0A556V8D3_BAGYA|nr:Ubl carboxyl-terminal hydrolase 18 [Bagarius yarrelli]